MQEEKWLEILDRVNERFQVLEHETKDLDSGPGSVEYVIFETPAGRIKIELTTKPVVLDKKAIGSRRIGSQTKVEYVYSETEKSRVFKAYKWNENTGEWSDFESASGFIL